MPTDSPDWHPHSSRSAERFCLPTAQPSPKMSLTGPSSTMSTLLNHSLARTCSLTNCQGLVHGYISGARKKMLLPEWRAIDADQDKILSVTFCLFIFIYSFIHFAESYWGLGVCWKLGVKSWTTSSCPLWCSPGAINPMMNSFTATPSAELGIPPDAPALLSKYLDCTVHNAGLYWWLLIFRPNFFLSSCATGIVSYLSWPPQIPIAGTDKALKSLCWINIWVISYLFSELTHMFLVLGNFANYQGEINPQVTNWNTMCFMGQQPYEQRTGKHNGRWFVTELLKLKLLFLL